MFSALTFNMQNGQVWNEGQPEAVLLDLSKTVEFLRAQNPDVIFLQEVEEGHEGGGQVEPPPNYSYLQKELSGYHSVFAYPEPNPLEIPFGLGLAIFSKFPLVNFFREDLPPLGASFEFGGKQRQPSPRLLIGAEADIDGQKVRLLNCHLQAFFMIGCSSDNYRGQRDIVEERLKSDAETPTLLAGDFNCAPTETLVQQFESAGFHPVQKEQITWRRMPFVLDHIFFNAPLRLERQEVIPTIASDHHAVRAEFSFSA